MPRTKLIRQNEFPYHVYTRSNNKEWFKVPLSDLWEICYEALLFSLKRCPVEVHSFVLMGNHYHLLLTTPNSDLDKFMKHFNWRLSFLIRGHSGAENHKFANRYRWTVVDSQSYLFNIYRYIYQNPVRAKLCRLCIDYPFSSLRFTPSQVKKLSIRVHINYFESREWMETHNSFEFNDVIKKALKRPKFIIPRDTRMFVKKKLIEAPR